MEDIVLRLSVQLPGFLFAIVAHEAAHAAMALKFGDDTAQRMGRLTLNPAPHLDMFGTVIFPMIGLIFGWTMFGWAKPVPVDTRKFKNMRSGIFWVSFAGPLMNIALATFSAFCLGLVAAQMSPTFYLYKPMMSIFQYSVTINIILAVFNLIPFPPLDGSKMVSSFLKYNQMVAYESLGRFTFIFFIFLMVTGVLKYVLMPALAIGNFMINGFYRLFL